MTVCNITGWQCHCQPPETPCDGLAELRKAYAEWRALAERRKQELSLAEEGLANYAQENGQLRSALKGLSDMYARTWDRVDGALVMLAPSIDRFEEAHTAARIALGEMLDGVEMPSEPQPEEHG